MTTTKHSLQAAGTGRCQEVRGTSTKKPMTGGAGVFASRGRLGWLFRSRLDWFVDASFVQNKTWFVLTFPSLWRQRCFWSGEERNSTTCPLAHLPPSPFCATPDRPSRLRHSGPLIKPTTIPFHCLSSPTNNTFLPSTTHISTLKPPTTAPPSTCLHQTPTHQTRASSARSVCSLLPSTLLSTPHSAPH